jgi:hypothetical protein
VCIKVYRGRILGRNGDKSLKNFPPCYSLSSLLIDSTPPSPWSKIGLKLVCKVNIVHGSLKSENFQDYAQKPQRNSTTMNPASVMKVGKEKMGIAKKLRVML